METIIQENQQVNRRRRGRPEVKVEWPTGEFTVEDISNSLNRSLTKVAIQLKINKARASGLLELVGKQPSSNGRPRLIYKANTEEGAPVQEEILTQEEPLVEEDIF
jgi:predicted transcriptional regulator